jgi:hypothetical protein
LPAAVATGAVVNEAFVRRFSLTENPIGRRFGIGSRNGGDLEIIGVVRREIR